MEDLHHIARGDPGLLPDEFWRQSLRLTQGRRDRISSYYCEIRLGARAGQIDLLYAMRPGDFSAWCDAFEATDEDSAARRLSRLIRSNRDRVSGLWFEHDDVVGPQANSREPSLCVCLVPLYRGERVPEADPVEDIALIGEFIEGVRGEFSPRDAERVRLVVGGLPGPGRFIHLSFMVGRQPQAVKLYGVVPRSGLLGYLHKIGWSGPLEQVASLMEMHCPARRVGEEIYLDLTLDTLSAPDGARLGFAFTPQHLAHSRERDPERGPLLDLWVEAGLCSVRERDILVRWPARSVVGALGGDSWPMRLQRWLDLKLVWDPVVGVYGKAYLGFAATPVSPFETLD